MRSPRFAVSIPKRVSEALKLEYPANYDDTYDPTNLASATTAPFTVALGTQIGQTTYTNSQVMLPTIFAAAGDTLAS